MLTSRLPSRPRPSVLGRARPLLTAIGLAATLCLVTPAGSAVADTTTGATSDAPQTTPDSVSVPADSDRTVAVLANDSDPDGDYLVLCRTDLAADGQPQATIVAGSQNADQVGPYQHGADRLDISTAGVEPGRYTVTYHACDFEHATAGTVDVTVTTSQNVAVTKVAGRAGAVRFANPAPDTVQVDYFVESKARGGDVTRGHLTLAGHGARTIHVTGAALYYQARHGEQRRGEGEVRGLRQSGAHRTTAHAAGRRTARAAAADTPADTTADQAPVTHDDTFSVESDGFSDADVLANDTDPDGTHDGLQVCRIAVPADSPLEVDIEPIGLTAVAVPESRRATQSTNEESASELGIATFGVPTGTYTLTYWACDDQLLTPATLTVKVTPSTELQVSEIGPHSYRFHNPGPYTYHVRYGPDDKHLSRPFALRPGASRRVHQSGDSFAFEARGPHHSSSGGTFSNGRRTAGTR